MRQESISGAGTQARAESKATSLRSPAGQLAPETPSRTKRPEPGGVLKSSGRPDPTQAGSLWIPASSIRVPVGLPTARWSNVASWALCRVPVPGARQGLGRVGAAGLHAPRGCRPRCFAAPAEPVPVRAQRLPRDRPQRGHRVRAHWQRGRGGARVTGRPCCLRVRERYGPHIAAQRRWAAAGPSGACTTGATLRTRGGRTCGPPVCACASARASVRLGRARACMHPRRRLLRNHVVDRHVRPADHER
jgi:hypothetical protein